MASDFSYSMEQSLLKLVNEVHPEYEVCLEKGEYQRIEFYVHREEIMKEIMKKFKFKDIGNVYKYADTLPQPSEVNIFDMSINFDNFHRIAVSKKINSILFYTTKNFSIYCVFLVDTDYLRKFSKNIKKLLRQDSTKNLFKDIDFKCSAGEYIEISDNDDEPIRPVAAIKKKVADENLVFEENSPLSEVMNDIEIFFRDETKRIYEKMQIAYKRGIILYGDPGNGKSATIREIIRRLPKITKIVITRIRNLPKILSSLVKALDGKKAIIIIEDFDSFVNERNRSELLNILDGIEVKSGIFFIGTTNYPDKIDPAFMNRSGRFDRTYKIDNPSELTRRYYFESRKIGDILAEYKTFKNDNIPDSDDGVVELFVKYSEGFPMASLKELMTTVRYILAGNQELTIEEALEKAREVLISSREEHLKMFKNRSDSAMRFVNKYRMSSPEETHSGAYGYDDDDDE